jgi:hypothetical protein
MMFSLSRVIGLMATTAVFILVEWIGVDEARRGPRHEAHDEAFLAFLAFHAI